MSFKEELIEAVEANVEDFYGDPDVDDIVTMSVEDVFNAFSVHPQTQEDYWGVLCEAARSKYQVIYNNDH